MPQNINNKTERRIIAVAIGIISGCISFSFYSDGVSGAKLIIVAGLVIALKTGEFFFAMDIFNYWHSNKYKSAGAALLVAVFYVLSVAATSISWYMQPQKEVAKLDVQRDVIKALQSDVDQAKIALADCPSMTFKNCINPKTAVLTEKQNALAVAIASTSKLSDVIATAKTWDGIAAFFNTDRKTLEFGRDLVGGMLFDLIGILFFAQSGGHAEIELKPQSKKEKKKKNKQSEYVSTALNYPANNDFLSEVVQENNINFIDDAYKSGLMKTIDLKTDVLVCSPIKGSGKSAIAALFARMCKEAGHRVIVIDINFKRNAENTLGWYLDNDIEVVGAKGNYREITAFFNGIKKEIADRHNRDDMNYPQITIIVDEMVSLVEHIPSDILTQFLKTLLSNGRQLRFNLMICTHADTIEGTGLKGITALKDGMACELMPFFEYDNNNERVYLTRKTTTVITATSKKPIKKSEIYYHPGVITANWRVSGNQSVSPNFKPVLDKIVNAPAKDLKKSLNHSLLDD